MEMDQLDDIDEQFNRAVQIVQSLPKTGPIQTGYEEKLAMYSLYKQATIGNVKGPRPPMWDMLGRAKWDAWSKHKDLETFEAKCKYVDELLHVLRKYSDKTVARDLVRELESFGGDPAEVVESGSLSESHDSDSSSSSHPPSPSQSRRLSRSLQLKLQKQRAQGESEEDETDNEHEELDKMGRGLQTTFGNAAPSVSQSHTQSLLGRPQSSLSTNRYRTPMGGSLVMSPPPLPIPMGPGVAQSYQQQGAPYLNSQIQAPSMYVHPQSVQHTWNDFNASQIASSSIPGSFHNSNIPSVQPMPAFETPSAFQGPSPPIAATISSPGLNPSSSGSHIYSGIGTSATSTQHPYPSNMYPGHPAYRAPLSVDSQSHGAPLSSIPGAGMERTPLERAVESLQAHFAALQERLETIEARVGFGSGGPATPYQSRSSTGGQRASPITGGNQSPFHSGYFGGGGGNGENSWSLARWVSDFDAGYFDWEHMGLWSTFLAPVARLTKFLLHIVSFLAARRQRSGPGAALSPGLVVLRRLLLDMSFVLCAVFVGRRLWSRSGIRRREVVHALAGVWSAIVGRGSTTARVLVDRGV